MLEKEIKVLDVDKESLISKLEELWAEKSFEGFVHDIYYDFPSSKMEWEDRIFRVRKKGETHLYTIKRKRKKKIDWIKAADEHETKITDVDSFTKVLEKYGMNKVREKKKYRTSYSLNHIEFDIDDYDEIPSLLEIEAGSNEEIQAWVEKLWLKDHKQKRFWSRGLFEYYGVSYNYF